MITNGKLRRTSSVRLPNRKNQSFFSGYLRKHGKKIKSSKRYFFVLENDGLFYYSNSEKLRCVGTFPLEKGSVSVKSSDSDATTSSADRIYAFQLNCVHSAIQNNSPDFREPLLLSASTEAERKDWLRALRKYLFQERGGGIFGTHLSETFRYVTAEMQFVPRVVYETAEFIKNYGIGKEGIFRKCGAKHVIQELADAYDCAQDGIILQPDVHDVHAAAGLLKLYLRELPEPVIPHRHYDRLKATGYQIDDGQDLQPIIDQLNTLPAPNYCLLQFLCQFLSEVSEHADESKMTIENLASMFAPNILRLADEDPDVEIAASPVITVTISSFIRCHEKLFTRELMLLSKLQMAANALPTNRPLAILITSPPSPDSTADTLQRRRTFSSQKMRTLPNRDSRNQQFWYPRDPHRFPTSETAETHRDRTDRRMESTSTLKSLDKFSVQTNKPIDTHSYIAAVLPSFAYTGISSNNTDSPPVSLVRSTSKRASSPFTQLNHVSLLRDSYHKPSECGYETVATNQSEPYIPNSRTLSQSSLTQQIGFNFFSEPGLCSNAPQLPSRTKFDPNLDVSPCDSSASESAMVTELRQLRTLINTARAESACARAKAKALQAELNRTRCDLNIAELEVSLLRKQLASLGIDVKHQFHSNQMQKSNIS